jgi:hypothetical protein
MRVFVAGVGVMSLQACGSDSTISLTAPTSTTRCALTAVTDLQSASPSGSSGALTIGVNRECSWTASADVAWIAFGGPTSGQGPTTIPFTVAPNVAVQPRRGGVAVNDQRIEIAQGAAIVVPPPPIPPGPPPSPTPPPTPSPPAPAPPAPAPTPPSPAPPSPPPAPAPPAPPAPTPPAPAPPATVVFEGKVSDVQGACPAVTFTVDKHDVRATAQTSIRGGNCLDIKNKTKVEVRGVVTAGDVVTASSITIVEKGDDKE